VQTAKPNYSPAHVAQLFNEMAQTYGAVNLISSFGFSHLWRKAAVRYLEVKPGHSCSDLMCGMGEAAELMLKIGGSELSLAAVDFCPEMTKRCAHNLRERRISPGTTISTRDVFDTTERMVFDRICCSFGLKTLDDSNLRRFAVLIEHLLKVGGRAAFVEIHVPDSFMLRVPYLFYVRHVIPFIGRLCLGNPSCYRNLALFTEDFASRDNFAEYLRAAGLHVTMRPLFLGCARLYLAAK